MDELKLTDTEQRYFSDLYLCCDHENTGKLTFYKATEFFQSSNIPLDVLTKITEIACQGNAYTSCDIINRKHFFAILKLIAAYQANIPLRRELLNVCIELPLPRFTWPTTSASNDSTSIVNNTQSSLYNNLNKQLEAFHLVENDTEMYTKNTDFTSTDSEVESQPELNNGDIVRLRAASPGASSTASDSPTPTNSIQERSWGVAGRWQGPPCEEQRQLLATEEESSDGEVSNEVWSINSEQREYYTKQFISLQPDVDGIVPGHVARPFFEKSRLPVSELRRIWQLADVTRDGALNLDEFSVAMHLVVLRRNNISLPDVLPEGLIPQSVRTLYPQPSPPVIQPPPTSTPPERQKDTAAREWTKFVDSPTSSISSPGPKPVNFDFHKSAVETDPKILHPVALRVTPEITPTNTTDEPEIQPRKSPRASLTDTTQANEIRPIQRPQAKIKNTPGPGALPPPPDAGPMSLPLGPPRKEAPPPPPPRPLRTHTRSSSLDLNRLGRIPPAVPPRASPSPGSPVKRLVNQRSEGDILPSNVQGNDDEGAFANFDHFITNESQPPVPETYENVLQSSGIFPGEQLEAERRRLFAQFTKVSTDNYVGASNTASSGPGGDINDSTSTNSSSSGVPRKHGAFEVYRKPQTLDNNTTSSSTVAASLGVNKKEMFRRLQEQNATLLRICQELSQELADVKEERIALTIRLEQQQQLQQQTLSGASGTG